MQTDNTVDRIVSAALDLLVSRGVKGTNLSDVASHAGVTRITVYRHFGDKKGLILGACMKIASVFQRAAEVGPARSVGEVNSRLNRLGMELAALPQGNLLARLEEIKRRYPDIYEQFRKTRQTAVDAIFRQALAAATHDGALRDGLDPEVLKAIFWAAVVGLIENPALVSSNVSLADVFATVTTVFRHGILKDSAGATDHEAQ
jgi:AcrR family transcriptional regulator